MLDGEAIQGDAAQIYLHGTPPTYYTLQEKYRRLLTERDEAQSY